MYRNQNIYSMIQIESTTKYPGQPYEQNQIL